MNIQISERLHQCHPQGLYIILTRHHWTEADQQSPQDNVHKEQDRILKSLRGFIRLPHTASITRNKAAQ